MNSNVCEVRVRLEAHALHRIGQVTRIAREYQGAMLNRQQAHQSEVLDFRIPTESQAQAFMKAIAGFDGIAALLQRVGDQAYFETGENPDG